MNKEQEQKFLNQIEEVLQAHEDTYQHGAWEEFDANRKKNKRKWPIYGWAAAAVVLLFACLGVFEIAKRDELHTDKTSVKNLNQPYKIKEDTGTTTRRNQVIRKQGSVKADLIAIQDVETLIRVSKANHNNLVVEGVISVATAKDTTLANLSFKKPNKHKPVLAGAYDSLTNRSQVVATSTPRKLTYSLMVSPSVSNQKMNFGAGMELSYKVGSRLSLNSGLIYSTINAKSDGKSLVAANSRPQSANLAVSGIELPLSIQYQTKDGFYATAGVSALGLIKDKLEYSFLEEKTVTSMEIRGGQSLEVLKIVSEKKTEKSIEPLNNYMGFFNFSVGKKQAFGNTHLNIGPFVKVPFNSVSSERIKLIQGGIKVGIDF